MLHLPSEIIGLIFSFLDQLTIWRTRTVSKKWYKLSGKFLREVDLAMFVPETESSVLHEECDNGHEHCHLAPAVISRAESVLFKFCNPQRLCDLALTTPQCAAGDTLCAKIFQAATNLVSLNWAMGAYEPSDSLEAFLNLKNLTHLTLELTPVLSKQIFSSSTHHVAFCTSLLALKIKGHTVYPGDMSFIAAQFTNLTSLSLVGEVPGIATELATLTSLSKLEHLELFRVQLKYDTLDILFTAPMQLKHLSLHRVTPVSLLHITKFTSLQFLDFTGSPIQDHSLVQIGMLPNLRTLILDDCYTINGHDAKVYFGMLASTLTTLSLRRCINFVGVLDLCLLSKLERLNLEGCSVVSVLNPQLESLGETITELHLPQMFNLPQIDNFRFLQHFTKLEILSHSAIKIEGFVNSLSACKNLRFLKLTGGWHQLDPLVHLPNLTALQLSTGPSQNVINYLLSIGWLRSLRLLSLQHCRHTQDIKMLWRSWGNAGAPICNTLVALDLSGCSGVQCNDLEGITCLTSLKYLSVIDCNRLCNISFKDLAGLQQLEFLRIDGLLQVTAQCLDEIAAAVPSCLAVSCYRCPFIYERASEDFIRLRKYDFYVATTEVEIWKIRSTLLLPLFDGIQCFM